MRLPWKSNECGVRALTYPNRCGLLLPTLSCKGMMTRLNPSPYCKALKRSKSRSRAVSVATCVLLSNAAISARERERAPELLLANANSCKL